MRSTTKVILKKATVSKLSTVAILALLWCVPSYAHTDKPEEVEPVSLSASDPLEFINRPIFAFNERVDRWIMRPIAQGYDYITPAWMRQGVSNALDNLGEVPIAVNSVLQGRFIQAATSSGRFLLNSTLGFVGFLDVAEQMGLKPARTDFGHTLASWGAPSGPYLVVPFLGPRTLRSGSGQVVDIYLSPLTYNDNVRLRNSIRGLDMIDARAALLGVDQLLEGDNYLFVRDAYLQRRERLINDGQIEDDFSQSFEDDWDDMDESGVD